MTDIGAVLIGQGDTLFIAQPQDRSIIVLGVEGTFVRRIGRRGEGPGEFEMLDHVGFLGDTLYALDSRLGRLSFFTPTGAFIGSERFLPGMISRAGVVYSLSHPEEFALQSDGFVLLKAGVAVAGEPDSLRVPFIRLDRETGNMTTVVERRTEFGESLTAFGDGVEFRVGWAFVDHELFRLMPNGRGVAIVDRAVARNANDASIGVSIVRPSGDTAISRRLPYEPVELSADMIRTAMEQVGVSTTIRHPTEEQQKQRPAPSILEEAHRDAGRLPEYQIPVADLHVGQDGVIWLRREERAEATTVWTVIDGRGDAVGRLDLPTEERVVASRGELVVTLRKDALDRPSLIVYRLHRGR